MKTGRKKVLSNHRANFLKVFLYVLVVIFMGNINAIVDHFLHPDIPYFDHEHIIVGLSIGIFSAVLGFVVLYYINRLQRINAERKVLADNLFQAKLKAEESDRLKSAFLANMSHEIRTPMNGIVSFAALLSSPRLTAEQSKTAVEMIQSSSDRMLYIINELLNISRIESGTEEIHRTNLMINRQLDYIFNLYKPEAEKRGITLRVEKALADDKAVLYSDVDKFYSILTNLVKNAIKYTDKGTIAFGYEKKHKPDNGLSEAMLSFYVQDTGIGIPEDRLEAIFERFVQADITDTEARQGVGLGLAIAKAYVVMLGGRIWVESEKGEGSTFWFQLPYDENYHPAPESLPVQTEIKRALVDRVEGLEILIVEDDVTSEKYLGKLLNNNVNTIYYAHSGEEAVEFCRNHPKVDFILMDIKMPNMNGYEATQIIREFNKDVIIIAQTAFALAGDRRKALESGCNEHITKPIARDDLLQLMQSYLK